MYGGGHGTEAAGIDLTNAVSRRPRRGRKCFIVSLAAVRRGPDGVEFVALTMWADSYLFVSHNGEALPGWLVSSNGGRVSGKIIKTSLITDDDSGDDGSIGSMTGDYLSAFVCFAGVLI